jgi:pimeloyl-ACP methyl ester carboxylesterase
MNGVALQSRVFGAGEPLVLVGGGLTGWLSWEPFVDRFRATRTVVLLQPLSVQLGLEGRPLPADYSVALEGRAVGAALGELALASPADVVAWSFGALAALEFALGHPERIRTLTLIEPPAFWVLHATGEAAEVQAFETPLRDLGDDVSEAQLESFLTAAGLVRPGTSARTMPRWASWNRHRQSLRNNAAVLSFRGDLDRLKRFDRPVLLVKGTGSSPVFHAAIDAMATRFPRAKVVEVPAGHGPHLVSTDRFLELLAEFQAGGDR